MSKIIPKQFILIGSPVAHSLSPILHKLFAAQFNIEIQYDLQTATADNYLEIIMQFRERGGYGINVTAPLKTLVFNRLNSCDEAARLANAVNTLTIKFDGALHGYNTDGTGLVCDLRNKAISIREQEILILGAGGAARGILGPLLAAVPKSVNIINRDVAKSKALVSDFKNLGEINIKTKQDLSSINAPLIINTTSAAPEYLDKLNFENAICYDLNYTPQITTFMKTALINGALGAYNGLGMLVEQAAAAFALWHSVYPNTQKALAQLQQNTVKKLVVSGL